MNTFNVEYVLLPWYELMIAFAAQKLAIRLSATKTYNQTKLVEINTRSLLSRWFSESGKLVDDLFEGLCRVLEDERLFVCLLIGEIHSFIYMTDLFNY